MKFRSIFSRKWLSGNIVVIVLAFFAMTCVFIDGVDYDASVKAGEVTVFNMHVTIDAIGDVASTRMVVGFLAPKSWSAAQHTTMTYTSNIDAGVQTMSQVPEGTVPKNQSGQTWPGAIKNQFGYGENVLNDLEWIVYWSDKTYAVANGDDLTAEVFISVKAGPENLKFKPTFFLNHTDDGLSSDDRHFKVFKGDCFSVTDGTGDVTDFCELHFNAVQPLTATKDDFVTFNFMGDVGPNGLVGVEKIFFCAKAKTSSGGVFEVCAQEDRSRMKKQFQFGNAYTLTIWPAQYFGIPGGEAITTIEYTFRNEDGSIEVKDSGSNPFVYTFKCQ